MPVGDRIWRRRFDRDRRRFDRTWPWMVALAALGAIVFVALIALGYLPLWLWFV